jgi:hypothetical protein
VSLPLLIREDARMLPLDLHQLGRVLLAQFLDFCLLILRKLNSSQSEDLLEGGLLTLLGSFCILR